MRKTRFTTLCLTLVIGLFAFQACKTKDKSEPTSEPTASSTSVTEAPPADKTFELPKIPDMLLAPEDRAQFMVKHYWDNFDFTDTSYVHLPEVTEQAFVNYAQILSHVDGKLAAESVKNLIESSKADETNTVYRYFVATAKKYLYEAESMTRNDEAYINVAQTVINDKISDEADKERARFDLSLMLKNRLGEKATNVKYTLASGQTGTLYNINSEYTLLYFYNPDCHACAEVSQAMINSPVINTLLQQSKLQILAYYPDEDLAIWQKHLPQIPSEWINGYDKEQVVLSKSIYDLKAMPTILLLDKNKKVLLKDVSFPILQDWLAKKANIPMY